LVAGANGRSMRAISFIVSANGAGSAAATVVG
jgi:hypothetical protein